MTFRLPTEVEKEIKKLALQMDVDKSKIIRELIEIGLKEKRLKEVLAFYTEGKVTLWKAARLLGISLWKMMEIVTERKITAQYGKKEMEEDLKALQE